MDLRLIVSNFFFFIDNKFFSPLSIDKFSPDNSITKIFFKMPFMINFSTENLKINLRRETMQQTSRNRLEKLLQFSHYYQYEMEFMQKISYWPWLDWSIKYNNLQKDLVFIQIVCINVFFLIDMDVKSDNESYLSPPIYLIYSIFVIFHLILSFTTVIVEILERYPLLSMFKGKVLEKHIPTGPLELTWMFLRDNDTLYYTVYFIVTCLAFISPIFYSVLL